MKQADLIIGAVLIPDAKTPHLITRDMLKLMRPGTVLVDVAVDQGGCIETCKSTTHENPTFIIDEVVHYCVANMPGAVPYEYFDLPEGQKPEDYPCIDAILANAVFHVEHSSQL